MEPSVIRTLDERGVDIFRINFSHTREEDIETTIDHVLSVTAKPLCLDLEGAQIRGGLVENDGVHFPEGAFVTIHRKPVTGDARNINLTPGFVVDEIAPGDLISIDFDTLLLQVTERTSEGLTAHIVCGGFVRSNRAVTVDRPIHLTLLTSKWQESQLSVGIRT